MSTLLYERSVASPVGMVRLVADDQSLRALYFSDHRHAVPFEARTVDSPHPLLDWAQRELEEYFRGERLTFSVPLPRLGTPFQQRVWEALKTIPFGQSRSYGQLAAMTGSPRAVRAVGSANGRNPVSIFVPCHRVIGSDGKLTGYGGGMPVKQWLLEHERSVLARARGDTEVNVAARSEQKSLQGDLGI